MWVPAGERVERYGGEGRTKGGGGDVSGRLKESVVMGAFVQTRLETPGRNGGWELRGRNHGCIGLHRINGKSLESRVVVAVDTEETRWMAGGVPSGKGTGVICWET